MISSRSSTGTLAVLVLMLPGLELAAQSSPTVDTRGHMGIGTVRPDPAAILDLSATNAGLLLPRMTSEQIDAIVNPPTGLLVFNTSTGELQYNFGTGGTPDWVPLISPKSSTASSTFWMLSGNALNAESFLGSTNSQPVVFKSNGAERMRIAAGGNLGIGTTSPAEMLDVGGNIRFSGALMPAGNAGNATEILVSSGPGLPPAWQAAPSYSLDGDVTGTFGTTQIDPANPGVGDRLIGGVNNGTTTIDDARTAATIARDGESPAAGDVSGSLAAGYSVNSVRTAAGTSIVSAVNAEGTEGTIGDDRVANDLTIEGGSVDNTPIGGTGRSTGAFTDIDADGAAGFGDGTGDDDFTVNPGSGTVSFSGSTITNVGTPVAGTDAATRSYVDEQITNQQGWTLDGNAAGPDDVLGTTNAQDLNIIAGGSTRITIDDETGNVGVGGAYSPLDRLNVTGNVNTTTQYNIGGGRVIAIPGTDNFLAGVGTGAANTTGYGNTFVGDDAGAANTTGYSNTFVGDSAGVFNTTGELNTAVGSGAFRNNTTGYANSAFGWRTLEDNNGGFNNTGLGMEALTSNTTGNHNTAVGVEALQTNTTGGTNTAVGVGSMNQSTTGSENTAVGNAAMNGNISGSNNTAVGVNALSGVSTGDNNTGLGKEAGLAGGGAGSNNTFIGYQANPSTSELTNATAIGAGAIVGQSNALVLGNNADVGIGTGTPARRLEVAGTAQTANVRLGSVGGAAVAGAWESTENDGIVTADASGDLLKRSIDAVVGSVAWSLEGNAIGEGDVLGSTNAEDLNIVAGGSTRVTIDDATGNVGVGGAFSPTDRLSVTGNVVVSDTSNLQGVVTNSTGNIVLDDSVDVAGTVVPTEDGTYSLGADASRWSEVYVGGVHIGPANGESTENELNLRYAEGAAIVNVDGSGSELDIRSAAVDINTDLNVAGDLDVGAGNFTVTAAGNTDVNGTLNADGTTTLNGNIALGDAAADAVTLNGTLTGAGSGHTLGTENLDAEVLTINGAEGDAVELRVNGDANVGGTLTAGDLTLGGDLNMNQNDIVDAGDLRFGSAASQIDNAAGDVTIDDSLIVTGTIDARGTISNSTGDVTVGDHLLLSNSGAAAELRLREPSAEGVDYTAFAAQAQAESITYTLPAANGTAGQALTLAGSPTATAGTLVWDNPTAGSLLLPFSQTLGDPATLFTLTNTDGTSGGAGSFVIDNPANTGAALSGSSNGAGVAVTGMMTGTGRAADFRINNPAGAEVAVSIASNADSSALFVEHSGDSGNAGRFMVTNSANPREALHVQTAGLGSAANLSITNSGSSADLLKMRTTGTGDVISAQNAGTGGRAAQFRITDAANGSNAVQVLTSGTGNALDARNNGTAGSAAQFRVGNNTNESIALDVRNDGLNSAGRFRLMNGESDAPALEVSSLGLGPAILAQTSGNEPAVVAIGGETRQALAAIGHADVVDGNLSIRTNFGEVGRELRFYEVAMAGTNYTGLRAAPQSVDITYTLPGTPPMTNGSILATLTGGSMFWVDQSTLISNNAWSLSGNSVTGTQVLGTINEQDLNIVTGGTTRMTIDDATGNVGIGGAFSESDRLSVTGNLNVTGNSTLGTIDADALAMQGNIDMNGNDIIDVGNITFNASDSQISNEAGEVMVVDDFHVTGYITTDTAYYIDGNRVLSVEGDGNVWVGAGGTGFFNITGNENVAVGDGAMFFNTTGSANVAIGNDAMWSNTSGGSNIAIGDLALRDNTSGGANTAVGRSAMIENTTGSNNVALGIDALHDNETGNDNTALGETSLAHNISGSGNTAVGQQALEMTISDNNTAIGQSAGTTNRTGSNNTFVGSNAEPSVNNLTNATAIGADAVVGQNNAVVLGKDADVGVRTSTPRAELDVVGTGAIIVPIGNTGERPATPARGMIRFNTDTGKFEGYTGAGWVDFH